MKRSLLLFFIILLGGVWLNPASVSVEAPVQYEDSAWLRVQRNKIVNSKGQQVVLKGVNIADPEHLNTKKWDRPGVNARQVAQGATDLFHAKIIRLPILPGDPAIPTEGFFGPINGGETYFLKHIKPLVEELTSKGIYVIIDLHYISDYDNLLPEVEAFWSFMAPQFKDNPYILFEIFNEPINPDDWGIWKVTLAQPIVNLIRSLAPRNLILVSGPHWATNIKGALRNPIQGSNIVYVAHVYANQTPEQWEDRYSALTRRFPLFISEWGFEEASPVGGTIEYGRAFEAWMRRHHPELSF